MLLVSVVNETTNAELDLSLPVLWDDTVQQMKEKLFCYTNIPGQLWYPRLISVKLDNEILTKDSLTLIQSIDWHKKEPVYVKHLMDEIQSDFDKGLLFEMNEDKLNDLYDKYKDKWTDISNDDIEFCTRFITFKSNPIVYANLRPRIEDYLNKVLAEKQKVSKIYQEEQDKMGEYYQFIKNDTRKDLVDVTSNIFSMNVLFKRKGPTVRFINILQLFNSLDLDETIPFVALSGSVLKRKPPAIRVYNQLFEIGVSEKEFKNWFVNEKVKLGQMTYKKIKGILIKYKIEYGLYLTINISETGDLSVNFSTNKQMSITNDYANLSQLITEYTTTFINTLDTKYNHIYKKGSSIKDLSYFDTFITNITANGEIKKVLKNKLATFLKSRYYSENLFDPKDTLNKDILSMFYKKYGKMITDDDDEIERKGITTIVQNHPENLTKSLVTVNLANCHQQIIIVLLHIQYLSRFIEKEYPQQEGMDQEDEFVFAEEEEKEHKLKMKSNIKQLKEQGVKVLSTNCQKQRQPIISDSMQPLGDSYELTFNHIRYICDKEEYPYPGFTNENIICCFKKDQRRKEPFIRNISSQQLEENVQPSNYFVEIMHNNIKYKTFVIKSLSDLKKHKYHFLDNLGNLIPITNDQLILQIDTKEDLFLEPVPLTVILTAPPKNKCNYAPDFDKRLPEDIHAQCRDIHADKKFFGYNLNGYPCCFDKPRKEIVTRKKKEVDLLKQHIITTDKILESNRLGTLPNGLNQLFNVIAKNAENENSHFYRMGVIQNNSSLLNVILLVLDNKINDKLLANSIDFRNLLAEYVSDNSHFKSLNQGDVSLTFSKDQFILYLTQNTLRPSMILDLLTKLIHINIIILDYTNEHNITVLCSKYITYDTSNPFMLIAKRGANYELIIRLDNEDSDRKLTKQFSYSDDIIRLVYSYYIESCSVSFNYPEVYPYKKPLSHKLILKVFSKSEDHKIESQIINEFNKTHLLLTKSKFLIPIMETGIIPDLSIQDSYLPSLDVQLKGFDLLNKALNSINGQYNKTIDKAEISGQIIQSDKLVAVMTNYGIIIPISPTEKVKHLPIYDYHYYSDVDHFLYNDASYDTMEQLLDQRLVFTRNQTRISYFVYKAKLFIANQLSNNQQDVKAQLVDIIQEFNQTMENKFERVTKIIRGVLSEAVINTSDSTAENLEMNDTIEPLRIDKDLFDFIVDVISHDIIIGDNDSEIINNFVSKPEFLHEKRKDNIDSLISNINDLDIFIRGRSKQEL